MNKQPISFVLIVALLFSVLLHAVLLFVPDIRLFQGGDKPPLIAQIRPLPEKIAPVPALSSPSITSPITKKVAKKIKRASPRAKVVSKKKILTASPETPVTGPFIPKIEDMPVEEKIESDRDGECGNAEDTGEDSGDVSSGIIFEPETPLRLPTQGEIRYRVDKGDSNFEVGRASTHWQIANGRYRLSSTVETTGLVWLFKSLYIEMESKGRINQQGLLPETFVLRHQGREIKEWAVFDWDNATVQVGNSPERDLITGSQDLLSFNFQLGFAAQIESVHNIHVVTGKNYKEFKVEIIGQEEIEVPAGVIRTIHIRAPGENMTELWLAYDYLLLPVKIRHVDKKGNVLVQVATDIKMGEDTPHEASAPAD